MTRTLRRRAGQDDGADANVELRRFGYRGEWRGQNEIGKEVATAVGGNRWS
jgi:hypothetical protein